MLANKSLFLKTTWLILGLGISCTIGYGTLFYSFSLLSIELEAHFHWSKQFLFGMYSIGVLLSGLASPIFGKWLDKYQARIPMTIGSLITIFLLFFLAKINTKLEFAVGIILLEAVSILVLYETAFVAITQNVSKDARSAITKVTLIAGFASTIFWPFISWILSWSDWRMVYWIMAGLHCFICLPIHWFILKPQVTAKEAHHSTIDNSLDEEKLTPPHNYLIEAVLAFCLGFSAFTINSLQIHIFRIMEALSIPESIAILSGVLVGPFQVIARLLDMLLGQYITPLRLGLISFWSMALGILLLIFTTISGETFSTTSAITFACLFGAGQGLSYIVRGVLPLVLFNPLQYGTITGRMNSVRMVMTAIAPFSFAMMMDTFGVSNSLLLLLFILILSIMGLIWLGRKTRKHKLNSL